MLNAKKINELKSKIAADSIEPKELFALANNQKLNDAFNTLDAYMAYLHKRWLSALTSVSQEMEDVLILCAHGLVWHFASMSWQWHPEHNDLLDQLNRVRESMPLEDKRTVVEDLAERMSRMIAIPHQTTTLCHAKEIDKICKEIPTYKQHNALKAHLEKGSVAEIAKLINAKGFDFNYEFPVVSSDGKVSKHTLVARLSSHLYPLNNLQDKHVFTQEPGWRDILLTVIEKTDQAMLTSQEDTPPLLHVAASNSFLPKGALSTAVPESLFESIPNALYKKIPNEKINAIYKGYTALDIALELKNNQMVTWLLTHGGHLADVKRWQSISNEFYATTTAYQKFVALYPLLKWRLDRDSLPVELYGIVIKQMNTLDEQSPLGKALACTGPEKTLEIGLALNEYKNTVGTNGHIELFGFCIALVRRLHRFDLLQPLFNFGNSVLLPNFLSSDRERYNRQWYDELVSTTEFDLVFAGFLISNDLDISGLDEGAKKVPTNFTEKFTPDMDITVLKYLARAVIAMRSQQREFSFPFFTERTSHVEILKECLLETTIKRPAVFLAIKNALSGCTKEGTAWAVLKVKMESLYFQSLFTCFDGKNWFLDSAQTKETWERFTALAFDERMQLLPYIYKTGAGNAWKTALILYPDNVNVLKFWGHVFASMAPGKDAQASVEVRTLNALLALPSPAHHTLALAMIDVFDAYSKKSPFIDVAYPSDGEGCLVAYSLLSNQYLADCIKRIKDKSPRQIQRLEAAIKDNVPQLVLLAMADPMFDLKSVFITGACFDAVWFDGKKDVKNYSLLAIAALALEVSVNKWWKKLWTDVWDAVLAHPDLGTIINAQEGGEKATVLDMVVSRGQAALAVTLVGKGARFSTDNTMTPSVLRSVVAHPFIGDDTRIMFIQMILAQHNEVAVKELCQIMRARYKTPDLSLAEQPWETQIRVYLETEYLTIWENSERSVPIIQETEIELPDLHPETHKSNEQKAPVVSVVSEGNGETKPAPPIVKFSEDYLTPQQRKAQEEQQERLNCIKAFREARLSEPEKKVTSMELT